MDSLNLHSGGQHVSYEDLALIEAPPATDTWFPIKHQEILDSATGLLTSAGYSIRGTQLSVAREGHQFFGVLDLTNEICPGINLAVGLRNSTNRTFPIGFCCGNRVFVCSNLSFVGSEIVISKKHTRFGNERYREGIAAAIASLVQYQAAQATWINNLREKILTPEQSDSLILRSYEDGLIGARTLPLVIQEWRKPSYDDFREPTAWNLWNCFTTVLGRKPEKIAEAALTTIRLQRLITGDVIDGVTIAA